MPTLSYSRPPSTSEPAISAFVSELTLVSHEAPPFVPIPAGDDPSDLTMWAASAAASLPIGDARRLADLWAVLARVGACDLNAARALESHADALSILHAAGVSAPAGSRWGVYAAHTPRARLVATAGTGGYTVSGRKPWCSLAAHLDYAVVTAGLPGGGSQTFSIDLADPGVTLHDAIWESPGLRRVPTCALTCKNVAAQPVGEPGWYLSRPGFAWGAIGVAACWLGGAAGVAEHLYESLQRRIAGGGEPDQVAYAALGSVHAHLLAAREALRCAADDIDAGAVPEGAEFARADAVRAVVETTARAVTDAVVTACGPGPLTSDVRYAQQLADLTVYLRQHHGPRDHARLGRALLEDTAMERSAATNPARA